MTSQLDQAIQNAIAEKRIVGTVVLIAKDGNVVYRKAHGLDDREAGLPMREETIFRLASMTKAITSVIALKLIEEGKLHFEDELTHYLPEFRPALSNGEQPVITVRNLLNHTAGFTYPFFENTNGPYHRLGISDGLSESGITLEENLQRLTKAPLSFEPGTRWQYSVAIDVLGAVIEKASGMNLEEAAKKWVTGPLRLKHTCFTAPKSWHLAMPYANQDPEPVRMDDALFSIPVGLSEIQFSPARAYNPQAFYSGGSGMVGSGDDYLQFLEAVRTGKLLGPKLNEAIFQNTTGDLSISLAGPGWGWGLISALLLDPVKANMPMGETSLGWSGSYGHTWWIDPKNSMSAVILTNCAFEGMTGKFPEEVRIAAYSSFL